MPQVFINNFIAQLTAPVAIDATSMAIDLILAGKLEALGLNFGNTCLLTLADNVEGAHEVVAVTAVSGAVLVVDRAQEGTASAAWPSGSLLSARLTAGTLAAIQTVAESAYATANYAYTELETKAPLELVRGAPTKFVSDTTYTLKLEDAGFFIEFTAATDVTVTIPPQSSVQWVGTPEIRLCQGGAGKVTVVFPFVNAVKPASRAAFATPEQHTVLVLKRRDYDLWRFYGFT